MADFVEGQAVYHSKWGEGVIVSFNNGMAWVWFSSEGYHKVSVSELQVVETRQGD